MTLCKLCGAGPVGRSSREQPRDGGWVDLEEAGRSGGRFLAFQHHLANRGLLVREELGAAAPHAPFLPGGLDAGSGAFPQHRALELREGPHHVHQHPAGWRRRVDRLGHAPEARAGVPEPRHDREHVAQRAREPIQLPDHHDVSGAQVREELDELGPVPPSAGRLLTKDALAPRRGQRRHLRRGVLIVRGHAGVPDQHCTKVSPITLIRQYRFATPNPLKTRPGPGRCKTVPLCNVSVWHKCLSGGAWLYAETQKGVGPHMLKDLVRLDSSTVRLWNGERWTRVVAWAPTQERGQPLEIVFRSGERIGCSPDHRWPTARGIVEALDLKVGDCLRSIVLPDAGPAPAWLTDDALWFAGLCLAEGSRSGDTIQVSGHVREEERWLRVVRLCNYYGAMPRRYKSSANSMDIHIDHAAALRAILDTVIAGRTAKDKHLTATVWGWDNGSLSELVRGYLSGDGSDRGNGRWRVGFTRNYGLERDLRTLAARLGAALTIHPAVAKIGEKEYPSFRGEWCWSRSGHWNEKDRAEVVKVRRSRARHCYDVAIANAPHLFALASGMLTHNSSPMRGRWDVMHHADREHGYLWISH